MSPYQLRNAEPQDRLTLIALIKVADIDCGPELRDILANQRSVLPGADERVAMVRYPQ